MVRKNRGRNKHKKTFDAQTTPKESSENTLDNNVDSNESETEVNGEPPESKVVDEVSSSDSKHEQVSDSEEEESSSDVTSTDKVTEDESNKKASKKRAYKFPKRRHEKVLPDDVVEEPASEDNSSEDIDDVVDFDSVDTGNVVISETQSEVVSTESDVDKDASDNVSVKKIASDEENSSEVTEPKSTKKSNILVIGLVCVGVGVVLAALASFVFMEFAGMLYALAICALMIGAGVLLTMLLSSPKKVEPVVSEYFVRASIDGCPSFRAKVIVSNNVVRIDSETDTNDTHLEITKDRVRHADLSDREVHMVFDESDVRIITSNAEALQKVSATLIEER